jgi:hypothetical protein
MTEDTALRLERKIDLFLERTEAMDAALPALQALGELVVEADYVTKAKRLNKNTISVNDKLEKFNGIGQRKTLIKLQSVAVVKNRKRK